MRRCPASSPPQRVLGIDPGLSATGYGVIDDGRAADYGIITTDGGAAVPARLARLAAGLEEVIQTCRPGCCAMETLFFKTVGARSVILSAQARGVLLLVLERAGVPVEEVTPATIKLAVTGSGRASKQQMGYMVRRLLGLDARVPEHAVDALAAAYCLSGRRAGRNRGR